jgi:hypothetical protein
LVVMLVGPFVCLGGVALWAALTWSIETVDAPGTVGDNCCLALDSHGHPHIAYRDYSHAAMKYAEWDGSAWQLERIQNGGADVDPRPISLVLDASDHPHMAYGDYGNGYALMYATHDGSSWSFHAIPGETAYYVSIALDGNGHPCISYADDWTAPYALEYAAWNGTSWNVEAVYSVAGGECKDSALVFDGAGDPHIFFKQRVGSVGTAKYATHDGGVWSTEDLETGTRYTGGGPDAVIDAAGRPHAIYQRGASSIAYAVRNGTTWDIELIVDGVARGWKSLALDSIGNPHVAYEDTSPAGSNILNYMVKSGGSWSVETVDTTDEGCDCSLALDSSGNPRICYQVFQSNLKFAAGGTPLAVRWPR